MREAAAAKQTATAPSLNNWQHFHAAPIATFGGIMQKCRVSVQTLNNALTSLEQCKRDVILLAMLRGGMMVTTWLLPFPAA